MLAKKLQHNTLRLYLVSFEICTVMMSNEDLALRVNNEYQQLEIGKVR